jgi:hypothetical protein
MEPPSGGAARGRRGGGQGRRRSGTPTGSSQRRGTSRRRDSSGTSLWRAPADQLQLTWTTYRYRYYASPAPTPRRSHTCHAAPTCRLYQFSLHDSSHCLLLASLSHRLHPALGSSPPQRLRVCQRVIAFAPVSHGGSPAARSRGRCSSRTSMPAGPSRCDSRPAAGKAGPPLACRQGGGWAQWRGETWVGCWRAPEGGLA